MGVHVGAARKLPQHFRLQTFGKFGCTSRAAAYQGEAEVSELLCRNVAEGESGLLPAGGQQDNLGGPGEVPVPVPRGVWSIWIRVVSLVFRAEH